MLVRTVVTATLHAYREDFGYYEERAQGLLASARDGTEPAARAFADRGAPLTEDGARMVVASEHGLDSWDSLRAHVADLPTCSDPFVAAYRAVESHDPDTLRGLLDEHPQLVQERGTNGNDLLGMAAATRDARLPALLLAHGADPAAANAHGWTALHQAAYSNQADLARALIEAGAPTSASARGDGGTPLIVALFWGHLEVSAILAAQEIVPGNLRAAAGLGELVLLRSLFSRDGRPVAAGGAHRGFYRPHGGFPEWTPSDDPQEALDEALAWAARSDRVEALATLVSRGARLEADVYRGTALAWAAATGRVRAVRRLVELGADPSGPTSFGGPDHGRAVTPLHLAAQGGRVEAVRALLQLGADPTLRDGLHHGTPAGWAQTFEQTETVELLQAAER